MEQIPASFAQGTGLTLELSGSRVAGVEQLQMVEPGIEPQGAPSEKLRPLPAPLHWEDRAATLTGVSGVVPPGRFVAQQ